jgi:hypothetical protein
MITANSFMKREFGKKLIEEFFPKIDLTHVIDTAGAFIPGHGTPTVILFGRGRRPVAEAVRAVLGIKGEPTTPDDASQGLVWQSIVTQIDRAGLQDDFSSTADVPRTSFYSHPWSIGGGGAAELKEMIDEASSTTLQQIIRDIGFMAISGEDDVFASPEHVLRRNNISYRPFCVGEGVRDWTLEPQGSIAFPYEESASLNVVKNHQADPILRWFWGCRTILRNRNMFGKNPEQHGLAWFEYMQFIRYRVRAGLSIAFAEVASHNHFVLDRGSKIFKQTAPIIMLPNASTEADHLAFLGFLNSSTVGFYLKQVSHQKQMTGGDGVRVTSRAKVPYQFAGARLQELPIPESFNEGPMRSRLQRLASRIDECARRLGNLSASEAIRQGIQGGEARIHSLRRDHQAERSRLRSEMIFLQEEIDFTAYVMFGLAEKELLCDQWNWPNVALEAGQRPFEVLQQRNVDDYPVPKEIPAGWPEQLQTLWRKRMDAIKKSKDLSLIEDDHYKRRWIGRQGLFNLTARQDELKTACEQWLLDKIEALSHGTTPEVTTTARLADKASRNVEFMQVAAIFRGRPDFDVSALVAELVEGESVPFLPILRYKPSGLRKREVWERTWDLQRQEDELASQRKTVEDKLEQIRTRIKKTFEKEFTTLRKMEAKLKDEAIKVQKKYASHIPVEDDWNGDRIFHHLQNEELEGDGKVAFKALRKTKQDVLDLNISVHKKIDETLAADKEFQKAREEREAIPDDPEIDVPPKYASADFQKSDYGRLRGSLDVPKERWISYPYCQSESDPSLVVCWAGCNHLQQATALVAYYDARKREGWDAKRLTPLLAGLDQLLPWIHQWHPEIDKEFGETAGQSYQTMLEHDAHELGLTLEEIRKWTPPAANTRRRARK